MADKKSKNPFEGLEVLTGNMIRRPFKKFLRRRLDQLRKTDEPAWLAVVWYHKREPEKATSLRNFSLVGLTVAENVTDALASKTGPIGQGLNTLAEQLMEDLPFTIREYFEEQPDTVFPPGYEGPAPGDLDHLTGRFKTFLHDSVNNFRNWMQGGFTKDFLTFQEGFIVAKATTELGPEAMADFSQWWMDLAPKVQHELHPTLRAINEVGEMGRFLILDPGTPTPPMPPSDQLTLELEIPVKNEAGEVIRTEKLDLTPSHEPPRPDERVIFLRSVASMNEFRFPLTDSQRQKLLALWLRFIVNPVKETTEWLHQQNLKMDPNYKDGDDGRHDEFSPFALKKNPFMHNLLLENDPRRIEYEGKKKRNRTIRNVLLGVAVLFIWAITSGSAQRVWAQITPIGGAIGGAVIAILAIVGYLIYRQGRRLNHGR